MPRVDAQPITQAITARQSLLSGPGGRYLGRIWLRLVLFLAPILALVVLPVYYVDPFGVFAKPSVIPDPIRSHYAQQVNQVFWKLPAYDRHPAANILLGDSEMAQLPVQALQTVASQQYSNLAYGGGTLRESVSTFWFASRRVKLQKVLFGISFMEYNPYPLDRVRQAEEITRHPALYFSNPDVLETTAYDISDAVFHRPINLMPQVNKAAFWASQLEYLTKRYKRNGRPQNLKDEIRKIADYCRHSNVSIAFVIPPQHLDAQRRIRDLGVEDEYQQFKNDLISMGAVYDCDINSNLTRDANNYADPFHLTGNAAIDFAEDLGSGNPKWCQVAGGN
jgi:hypothetical protein